MDGWAVVGGPAHPQRAPYRGLSGLATARRPGAVQARGTRSHHAWCSCMGVLGEAVSHAYGGSVRVRDQALSMLIMAREGSYPVQLNRLH